MKTKLPERITASEMEFDPYQHTAESALLALAESPAMDATLTWDGENDYRVQPSEKYTPLDVGHRAILTRSDLEQFCDGDLGHDSVSAAQSWVESNQLGWFEAAE